MAHPIVRDRSERRGEHPRCHSRSTVGRGKESELDTVLGQRLTFISVKRPE